MSVHINRLAHRLSNDRAFWSYALAKHRHMTGMTAADQADLLHTTAEILTRVAICKLPRVLYYAEDITRVADRFNLDRDALAAILDTLQL